MDSVVAGGTGGCGLLSEPGINFVFQPSDNPLVDLDAYWECRIIACDPPERYVIDAAKLFADGLAA